jgi:hypothetical protein
MMILSAAAMKEDSQGVLNSGMNIGGCVQIIFRFAFFLPAPLGETFIIDLLSLQLCEAKNSYNQSFHFIKKIIYQVFPGSD